MEIQLSYYPQALVLIVARMAAVTAGTVVFGRNVAPIQVRILVAVALAMVFTPLVPAEWARAAAALDSLPKLVVAMIGEVMLGVTLALICDLFVRILMVSGHVIGWSSSLTMANTLDPVNGTENNVLGALLQMVFVLLVWLYGGHLLLLKLIFRSFTTIPPLYTWLNDDVCALMVSLGATMFEWGVKLAAPVIAAAMILNCAMGLIAKMAPQFNILFLSLPIRLGTGMFMMGLFLRYGNSHMKKVFEQMITTCNWLVE